MSVKHQFTTVTPFSKFVALLLFLLLPVLAFYLGMKLQASVDSIQPIFINIRRNQAATISIDYIPGNLPYVRKQNLQH